jgi:hypothetical protein
VTRDDANFSMPSYWPHQLDYFEAVQMPAQSFADPDLRSALVAEDHRGMPQPWSGNFASVYQFQSADGLQTWAVKCFTRPVPRPNVRYGEISRCLGRIKLPLTVDFEYLEQGIRIGDEWFPIVKMEWVAGQTLRQFVEERLDSPHILARLFELWLKVEQWLSHGGIVHGDLQHANLLMVSGARKDFAELKLIDYDGIWAPSLSQHPSHEFGHSAYQHPHRARDSIYGPDVDRFPNLVIACALKCLARPDGRSLWERYDNGDNLLFTKSDFEEPQTSRLLQELWEGGDAEIQAWTGRIALAAQAPLRDTPLLSQIVVDGRALPLPQETLDEARRLLFPSQSVAAPIFNDQSASYFAPVRGTDRPSAPVIVAAMAVILSIGLLLPVLFSDVRQSTRNRSPRGNERSADQLPAVDHFEGPPRHEHAWPRPAVIVAASGFEPAANATWRPGQPPQALPAPRDGFCVLTGLQGSLHDVDDMVGLTRDANGAWSLYGQSQRQALQCSAMAIHALQPCVVEEHVWKSGRVAHRLIHQSEGFAVISSVGGVFRSAGQAAWVHLDSDGFWCLEGQSHNQVLTAKAMVVRTGRMLAPLTFRPEPNAQPVRLIHRSQGVCFISGVSGQWNSESERANLTVGQDGFWYFDFARANDTAWATVTAVCSAEPAPDWKKLTASLNDFSEWTPKSGRWSTNKGAFHGSEESSLTFKNFLPQDLTLRFKLNVVKGVRPKTSIEGCGALWLGNRRIARLLMVGGDALNPVVEDGEFHYSHGQTLPIEIRLFRETAEFRVHGKLIDTHDRRWPAAWQLTLSAGDRVSPGECLFSDFSVGPP